MTRRNAAYSLALWLVLAAQAACGRSVDPPWRPAVAHSASRGATPPKLAGCDAGARPSIHEMVVHLDTPQLDMKWPELKFPCEATTKAVQAVVMKTAGTELTDLAGAYGAAMERKDPGASAYYASLDCRVTLLAPTWVSMVCAHESFMGGAHPWHAYTSMNLALCGDGCVQEVPLTTLLVPGGEGPLGDAALVVVEPKAMLDEEQMRASVGRGMPYSVDEKGVTLWFGPYEAGPYVAGSRTAVVPWSVAGAAVQVEWRGAIPGRTRG